MKKIYLYVKKHQITGLKYFGKTTKKDPYKYKGSGKYWLNHLKKHGNLIDTEIIGVFENVDECSKVALDFSIKNNILESNEWANLRLENGLDGAPIGNSFSKETLKKMSESKKGKKPKEFYVEIAKKNVGWKQSNYQKQKVRELFELDWLIINPQGQKIQIKNLRKFCIENNLDQGNMVNVSKGKLKQYKGWKCTKLT
jgi:hypothetical protein